MTSVAIGRCFGCDRIVGFNPDRVPTIVICGGCQRPPDLHAEDCPRTAGTTRFALCGECVEQANDRRAANGLALINVLPGAYESEDY